MKPKRERAVEKKNRTRKTYTGVEFQNSFFFFFSGYLMDTRRSVRRPGRRGGGVNNARGVRTDGAPPTRVIKKKKTHYR